MNIRSICHALFDVFYVEFATYTCIHTHTRTHARTHTHTHTTRSYIIHTHTHTHTCINLISSKYRVVYLEIHLSIMNQATSLLQSLIQPLALTLTNIGLDDYILLLYIQRFLPLIKIVPEALEICTSEHSNLCYYISSDILL